MSAVLEVEGVGKRYGAVQALADVSFSTDAGEVVAVIGPNGAGKTTLLSIIAGSLAADSGDVRPAPERVGWAPQQAALYARLTVAENLELFARLERVPDPRAAVAAMLAQTELTERSGTLVGELSGGNRQRVNVALALIAQPPVLALDEPSAALDPAQRERLWRFVSGLAARGTAIVFSTHNVNEAQRYAQRAIVLADGRMLFDGTPDALLAAQPEAGADLERALVLFLEARARAAPAG
ncbi:MAG TPA: ABC transporter ATP-binding protein [Solirubrobacteraceae bacterium]|nr:ABC transporter ATP-binding protein [Solirubrobacteraceae bacterium]